MPIGKRHQSAKARKLRAEKALNRAKCGEYRTMLSQGVLFKRNGILDVGTKITNSNLKAIIRTTCDVTLSRNGKQCTAADARKALHRLTNFHFIGAHNEIPRRKRRLKPDPKTTTAQ